MHKLSSVYEALAQRKVLPLFYHDSSEVTNMTALALYKAGIRILEYTNRGSAALENFKALSAFRNTHMKDMMLGIGTIKNSADATLFIEAKADFIVAPTVNPEVGAVVKEAGLLWIPGCLTPTEIGLAESLGTRIVKIFPGSILGPSYIQSVLDIFPAMSFMPTGGVEMEAGNLQKWFKAGVVAVGMGSKLITKELLAAKDFAGIETKTKDLIDMIQAVSN